MSDLVRVVQIIPLVRPLYAMLVNGNYLEVIALALRADNGCFGHSETVGLVLDESNHIAFACDVDGFLGYCYEDTVRRDRQAKFIDKLQKEFVADPDNLDGWQPKPLVLDEILDDDDWARDPTS